MSTHHMFNFDCESTAYQTDNLLSISSLWTVNCSQMFEKTDPVHVIYLLDKSSSMQTCISRSTIKTLSKNFSTDVTTDDIDGIECNFNIPSLLLTKRKSQLNASSPCRSDIMIKALLKVLKFNLLCSNVTVTLISFDDEAEIILENQKITQELYEKLETELFIKLKPHGGTNIRKALQKCRELTLNNYKIFLLTDGENTNASDNIEMVYDMKISKMYDSCCAIGLGEPSDYNIDLLMQLSPTVRGGSTSTEINNHIVGLAFNVCTIVAKSLTIEFPSTITIKTPLTVEKIVINNISKQLIYLKDIDISQKLPFVFEIKLPEPADFDTEIEIVYEMKVNDTLKRCVMEVPIEENLIKSKLTTWLFNTYIETAMKFTQLFKEMDDNQVGHRTEVEKLSEKLHEWPKVNRIHHPLSGLWTALSEQVDNHLTNIKKIGKIFGQKDKSKRSMKFKQLLKLASLQCDQIINCQYTTLSRRTSNAITRYMSIPIDSTDIKCCVCKDKTRSVIFLPCKHLVCCKDCAELSMKQNSCVFPSCKSEIKSVLTANLLPDNPSLICIECNKAPVFNILRPCNHVCLCKKCAIQNMRLPCPVEECCRKIEGFMEFNK